MSRITKMCEHFKSKPDAAAALIQARFPDVHGMAEVIAAQYMAQGTLQQFPAGSPLHQAEALSWALLRREATQQSPHEIDVQSYAGCCTDYDVVPPSDKARQQERDHRKAIGAEYVGPRHVFPNRNKVGRFAQEWGYVRMAR